MGALRVRVAVGGRERRMSMDDGAAVSDLLRKLGVAAVSRIVVRDGIPIPHDEELRDGDSLVVIETFSGG